MMRWLLTLTIAMLASACALPKVGGAPVAPVERNWAVPTLELYLEWWRKTEQCSGLSGDFETVTFYAVDSPSGAISLGREVAHGWWIRDGNRIYLPANALSEEWLVRHEMLHALLQRGSHPNDAFVKACHLASGPVWRDSTLTKDPMNPAGD